MDMTVEAIVDEDGNVRLLEQINLDRSHRALITILADETSATNETLFIGGVAQQVNWNHPDFSGLPAHLRLALEKHDSEIKARFLDLSQKVIASQKNLITQIYKRLYANDPFS